MSNVDVDNWMHASDDERTEAIQNWNTKIGEGQEIVARVATLFKGECVYNVLETKSVVQDGKWIIEAFSETDDYETLKDRQSVEFLGFNIVFKHIDDYE